jgi:protein tyrosine phosphatase
MKKEVKKISTLTLIYLDPEVVFHTNDVTLNSSIVYCTRNLNIFVLVYQDSTDEAVKPMVVQQFHFTGWPDHGVPEPGYEIPVLDFVFKSTAAQVEGAGPIIVHCR